MTDGEMIKYLWTHKTQDLAVFSDEQQAVRQLRGEAHPRVQVKNCDLALAHGTGGSLGTRHGSATLILGRE